MIRISTEHDGVRDYPDSFDVQQHEGIITVYDDAGVEVLVLAEGAWRGVERVASDLQLAGEALSRARLASTALDLAEMQDHGSESTDHLGEAQAILSALCWFLVDAGAVDPNETS